MKVQRSLGQDGDRGPENFNKGLKKISNNKVLWVPKRKARSRKFLKLQSRNLQEEALGHFLQ